MICGEKTICVHEPGHVTGARLWCNTWKCEDCLPKRLRQLRDLASSGLPDKMLTLTVQPDEFSSPDEAARALVRGFRNLIQRGKREGRLSNFAYLAIFEEHKSGWPHLHVLLRSPYIPQSWISARMREYVGAPVVDIRKVYSKRHASRYVAKYVSKGPGRFDGCKRYWRSQNWSQEQRQHDKAAPDPHRTCWVSRSDIVCLAWRYEWNQWSVEWEHPHRFTAVPSPRAAWTGPKTKAPPLDLWRPRRQPCPPPSHLKLGFTSRTCTWESSTP